MPRPRGAPACMDRGLVRGRSRQAARQFPVRTQTATEERVGVSSPFAGATFVGATRTDPVHREGAGAGANGFGARPRRRRPRPRGRPRNCPWTTRANGGAWVLVASSNPSNGVIPRGARCAMTASAMRCAGPPRTPAAAEASLVVRHPGPGGESPRRAACAHRCSTRPPAPGAMAGHTAGPAFTAEAHAARRGPERRRAVEECAGLSVGAGRFLGSPPGAGVAAGAVRWAPLGMTASWEGDSLVGGEQSRGGVS